MAAIDVLLLAGSDIPRPHGAICRAGGNGVAIRRPRHHRHNIAMPSIGDDMLSSQSIPHLHCLILAPRDNALTSRGPVYSLHTRGMTAIHKRLHMLGWMGGPDLHGAV